MDRVAGPRRLRCVGGKWTRTATPVISSRKTVRTDGNAIQSYSGRQRGAGVGGSGNHRCLLVLAPREWGGRSEEHTSELQSLMRISYAVFCLKKKNVRITLH